jgi:predicted alpha-1,2-mannosidase
MDLSNAPCPTGRFRRSFWHLLLPIALMAVLSHCRPGPDTAAFRAAELVDPQIGSVHGRWFFYTPAALPFGMAKLAPHTNAYGSVGSWGPCGYDDRHGSIEGFGHFHEFQIGGVVFMPTTGPLKTLPGTLEDPDAGYRSRFKKDSEVAEPGYYSVFLDDYGIRAELTATERCGLHRYTYPAGEESRLIIDIGHKQGESSDVTEAWAGVVSDREVEGWVETYPEYVKFCDPGKRVKMYFVARFSEAPVSSGAFVDSLVEENARDTRGTRNGLYLTFRTTEGKPLEIRTGLSYTSVENARLNLEAEAGGLGFDEARERAREAWNEMLGRIRVEGGRPEDQVKFYTGLYHALLGRGLSSDVNGAYPLVDGGIGQIPVDAQGIPQHRHFNTDGIWGGFWNLSQVWALAYPDYFREYVQSNIDFYRHRGWLHDGEAAGVYTNGVQTNFQGLLLASAWLCGIRDFDVEAGYAAAVKNELNYRGRNFGNGKYDLRKFVLNGYVPYEDTLLPNGWVFNFGASHTLEYAFSSYAVAQMAKGLGRSEDHEKLIRQAGYYRNLFDPETKFIRPRLEDGRFISEFDTLRAWDGFQEGNAFQYTWYVPHDPAGLIGLMGIDLFNRRLEAMFADALESRFGTDTDEIHSFSGIGQLYNHGNQPSLHQAWLFNYSGKPWRSQHWVRAICDHFYGTAPLHGYGVGQDEDQGQLGAWYVMAAMGLFDVAGHTGPRPTFQLGSPLFDRVVISTDPRYYSGKPVVIETTRPAPDDCYIQSAELNGRSLEAPWLYRDELMAGGTLRLVLGPEPNEAFGAKNPPPSMSEQ